MGTLPDPAPAPMRGPVPTAILDAVSSLLRQRSWVQITMADVAERAGVSRQTVYNTFRSRQDLAEAYAQREGTRFVDAAAAVLADHRDRPREALAAALELFLGAVERHPLVAAIARTEGSEELLALFTTQRGAVLDAVTEQLSQMISDTWPIPTDETDIVADTLVRLAISHAASPTGTASATAANIAHVLGPFVDELWTATLAASER